MLAFFRIGCCCARHHLRRRYPFLDIFLFDLIFFCFVFVLSFSVNNSKPKKWFELINRHMYVRTNNNNNMLVSIRALGYCTHIKWLNGLANGTFNDCLWAYEIARISRYCCADGKAFGIAVYSCCFWRPHLTNRRITKNWSFWLRIMWRYIIVDVLSMYAVVYLDVCLSVCLSAPQTDWLAGFADYRRIMCIEHATKCI